MMISTDSSGYGNFSMSLTLKDASLSTLCSLASLLPTSRAFVAISIPVTLAPLFAKKTVDSPNPQPISKMVLCFKFLGICLSINWPSLELLLKAFEISIFRISTLAAVLSKYSASLVYSGLFSESCFFGIYFLEYTYSSIRFKVYFHEGAGLEREGIVSH